MAQGKLRGTFNLPQGYEAEILATALRANGWQNLSYSDLSNEITAEQRKSEQKGGMSFSFDFRVHCRWSFESGSTTFFVDVTDREQHSSQNDCRKLAHAIMAGIKRRIAVAQATLQDAPKKTIYGGDRFAENKDLEDANYLVDKLHGNMFLVGPFDGKRLIIPEEEACRHALVCGPTGCGKTTSVFIPNLIERIEVSALVTEATSGTEPPDLYTKTAGFRKASGHNIYYFNPDDLTSTRINPVDYVTSLTTAQELAFLIMKNTSSKMKQGESKFWQDAETQLLTSLLLHVSAAKGNLADIRSLLREGPQNLGEILAKSPIGQARDEYKAYLGVSTDNIRNGVACGLLQRLNNWINPKVVALTSVSDIDLTNLKDELFTFYFATPSDKDALKPVASLVLNFVLNTLKSIPKESYKHKLAMFLDEFTNFGYLPVLPTAMSIIRHQEIPIVLGCQDYSQIKIEYGDDETKKIFSNLATRFVYRTNDLQTAKAISESLGQETVVERKLNTSCQVVEKEVGKPLLRPSEVMSFPKEQSIVFTPSTPPVKVTRYSWQDYLSQTQIPPPHREAYVVDDTLIRFCADAGTALAWQEEAEQELNQTEVATSELVEKARQQAQALNADAKSNNVNTDDYELPI